MAAAEAERNPLLWLRGLVTREPEGFPADEERPERIWSWTPQVPVLVPAGRLFSASDGSGGSHTSDPRLRRASSAAVLIAEFEAAGPPPEENKLAVIQACAASVPGAQSSARAEIHACTLAVRMLSDRTDLGPETVVTHYTDYALLVSNGATLLAGGPVNREWPNADLYRSLACQLGKLTCRLRICKIKAHIDAPPARSDTPATSSRNRPDCPQAPEVGLGVLCPIGVFGNVVCDHIATFVAGRIQAPEATVAAIQVGDRLAYQILARLVHINIACAATDRPDVLPRKATSAKTPAVRREAFGRTLKEHLKTTPHLLRHAGRRAMCLRCRKGAPYGALLRWLGTPCSGASRPGATARGPSCAPGLHHDGPSGGEPSPKRARTSLDYADGSGCEEEPDSDQLLPPPPKRRRLQFKTPPPRAASPPRPAAKGWVARDISVSKATEAAIALTTRAGVGTEQRWTEGAGWGSACLPTSALHLTHSPHWRGRFLWCGRCGSWTAEGRPGGALQVCCPAKPTRSGKGVLSRVSRGLPPHSSHREWA